MQRYISILLAFVLAISLFVYIVLGCYNLFDVYHGDSSIYFSYAKQNAKGDIFSFNPGEFSSGSTSPIWALILSAAFIFDKPYIAGKWISVCFMLIALILFVMFTKKDNHLIAILVAACVLLFYYFIPTVLIYETSLVALASIVVMYLMRDFEKIITHKYWLAVIAIFIGILPLIRPEMMLTSLIIIIFISKKVIKHIGWYYILFMAITLIPALSYYGYSFWATGVISNSGYCRSFALKEAASRWHNISYSLNPIKDLFLTFPQLLWFSISYVGIMALPNSCQLLKRFLLCTLACYLVLFTLIIPITCDTGRYLNVVFPFLCYGLANGINMFLQVANRYVLLWFFLLYSFSYVPLKDTYLSISQLKQRGYSFDVITERGIAEYLNGILEREAILLAYEVQSRYWLRDDIKVLSLDGITDGKIAPYLHNSDLLSFIKKYKPNYWLANDAVNYRPFLRNSVLKQIFDSTDTNMPTITIDGITFHLLKIRDYPHTPGLAGWTRLYKVIQ